MRAIGYLRHFVMFGLIVTDKLKPNDVDAVIIMDDDFE